MKRGGEEREKMRLFMFSFMYELVHTLILILRARKVVATTSYELVVVIILFYHDVMYDSPVPAVPPYHNPK